MADLNDNQAAQSVKVVGSDNTGVEQVPVQSTANGGLHINLRDNAGVEKGTISNPVAVTAADTAVNINSLLAFLTNANFLKQASFTSIIPTFVDEFNHYDYYEGDARIARATIRYISNSDWDITLQRFINDSDGDELLDDDSTFLNLD